MTELLQNLLTLIAFFAGYKIGKDQRLVSIDELKSLKELLPTKRPKTKVFQRLENPITKEQKTIKELEKAQ